MGIMKARASVRRKPDAHVFLEGQILNEDFPLYPGGGEDEPTARLRTSPRRRLVQDHNPTERIRPRRVQVIIRSAVTQSGAPFDQYPCQRGYCLSPNKDHEAYTIVYKRCRSPAMA